MSRNIRPETGHKLTLYCRPRDCEPQGGSVPGGPSTLTPTPAPRPLPSKAVALSARVSPWTSHFPVLDKSLLPGSGRDPSCNTAIPPGPYPTQGW